MSRPQRAGGQRGPDVPPRPGPRSNEPQIPAPAPSSRIPDPPPRSGSVECDCAAGLRRIESKVDGLIATLGEYQQHLGDTHATSIGDGLAVQMSLGGLHTAVAAVAANQANLVEVVTELVGSNNEVAGELFGIADGLAAAADQDDEDQGERTD